MTIKSKYSILCNYRYRELCKYFNVVDSFDTHARIFEHYLGYSDPANGIEAVTIADERLKNSIEEYIQVSERYDTCEHNLRLLYEDYEVLYRN